MTSDKPTPPTALSLGQTEWKLCSTVGLRAAGFAVAKLRGLADDPLPTGVRAVRAADLEAKEAQDQVLERLRQLASTTDDRELRREFRRVEKLVRKGRSDEVVTSDSELQALVRALDGSRRSAGEETRRFRGRYAEAQERVSRYVAEQAADPRFREALAWQNARLLTTCVDKLLSDPLSRSSRARQHRATVVHYLQRYAGKNETIGFFGPVGWMTVVPEARGVELRAEPDLIRRREVFHEAWGLDAVAAKISTDERMQDWLKPRVTPFAALHGEELRMAVGGRVALTEKQARLVALCDGTNTRAAIIAQAVQSEVVESVEEASEVFRQLAPHLLSDIVLPTSLSAFEHLRAAVADVGDPALRAELESQLETLERGRSEVGAAAGDPEAIARGLEAHADAFAALTGESGRRRSGNHYAARTLLVEDCQRGVDCGLGGHVVEALAEPLALVLRSARWSTVQVRDAVENLALQVHADLSGGREEARVPALAMFMALESRGYRDRLAAIAGDVQKKWLGVLGLEGWAPGRGADEVVLDVESIRALVEDEFAAEGPGWEYGRLHSPDVMISARDASAIAEGEYDLVLGELHMASCTLRHDFFLRMHDQPSALLAEWTAPLERGVVFNALPKEGPLRSQGLARGWIPLDQEDLLLDFSGVAVDHPADRVVAIGELEVARAGDSMTVRTLDGRLQLPAMEFFGRVLGEAIKSFRLLPGNMSLPRVRVGSLIVQRRQWSVDSAEVLSLVADASDDADEYIAVLGWVERVGMPRWCFVKTPIEPKPELVDWCSPPGVRAFIKRARGVLREATRYPEEVPRRIVVQEMLPDPEHCWCVDAEGRAYCSELRLVVVDGTRPQR